MDNLFADLTPPLEGERFDVLLRHKGLTIERIVSSPRIAHERYVQAQDEWVVLLQGHPSSTPKCRFRIFGEAASM